MGLWFSLKYLVVLRCDGEQEPGTKKTATRGDFHVCFALSLRVVKY